MRVGKQDLHPAFTVIITMEKHGGSAEYKIPAYIESDYNSDEGVETITFYANRKMAKKLENGRISVIENCCANKGSIPREIVKMIYINRYVEISGIRKNNIKPYTFKLKIKPVVGYDYDEE